MSMPSWAAGGCQLPGWSGCGPRCETAGWSRCLSPSGQRSHDSDAPDGSLRCWVPPACWRISALPSLAASSQWSASCRQTSSHIPEAPSGLSSAQETLECVIRWTGVTLVFTMTHLEEGMLSVLSVLLASAQPVVVRVLVSVWWMIMTVIAAQTLRESTACFSSSICFRRSWILSWISAWVAPSRCYKTVETLMIIMTRALRRSNSNILNRLKKLA